MTILKEDILSIIDDIVIPLERLIMEDDEVAFYLRDDKLRAKHNMGVTKISLELLKQNNNAKNYFLKASKIHNEVGLPRRIMKKYMSIFFNLHRQWCIKYSVIDSVVYEKYADKFDVVLSNAYKEDDVEEDEFLMFDSEEVDDMIDDMHYQDQDKITAKEYASYEEILDDDLSLIIELKDECEELTNQYGFLSNEYRSKFINIISTLAGVLFITGEFKDVGYALNSFVLELNILKIDSLDGMQQDLSYGLLSQMNEDIQNWILSVFVNQDAVDIHYFDASLLANIAQFSIMLEQDSSKDESDDDFLF